MKDEKEIKTTERIYRDYCQFNKIKEPNKKWIPVKKVLTAIEEFEDNILETGEMSKEDRATLTRKFDILKDRLGG